MGSLQEPSVVTKDLSYLLSCCELADACDQPVRIDFELRLTESTAAVWETVFWEKRLYIAVEAVCGQLPQASKEGFVSLLEFAEEELGCTDIIVCIPKTSNERAALMKTFMFLGFELLPPGHELVPPATDKIFMCYTIDD